MKTRVEGIQRSSTGGHVNVGKALFLVFCCFLAIGDGEGGWNRVAFLVEEVEGTMIDGGVAWLEKGTTDGVANLVAFCINSLNVEREAGGKGIKDGTRWDGLDVRTNGSKSRA